MSYDFAYNQLKSFVGGNGALLHCTHDLIKVLSETNMLEENIENLGNGFKLKYPSVKTCENEDEGLWEILGYDSSNGILCCVTDEYIMRLPNDCYIVLSEEDIQDFFTCKKDLASYIKAKVEYTNGLKKETQNV